MVSNAAAFDAMCLQLQRIGYDNILGYLYGGIAAWQEAGYPIRQLWQISAAALKDKLMDGRRRLFDVRTPAEWEAGRIRQATHLPLTTLLQQGLDAPEDEEIIVTCGVGYRGNIAASFLGARGYRHVHSLAGGMKAWVNAGYETTT